MKSYLSIHSQILNPVFVKVGSLIAFARAPGATTANGRNERNATNGAVEESNKHQVPYITFALTKRIFLFNKNRIKEKYIRTQ